MVWDSTKPVGTDLLANSHQQIVANWQAIEGFFFEAGDIKYRMSPTITIGRWLLMDGKTIGDASSGGTARANADTIDLFTLLWDNLADADAPVSGGRGASAVADYGLHKTITLPDARGLALTGAGTNGTMLNANAVAFVRTLGHKENDMFQGHRMAPLTPLTRYIDYAVAPGLTAGANYQLVSSATTGDPVTDTVNGAPRKGAETRMANISAYLFIKY